MMKLKEDGIVSHDICTIYVAILKGSFSEMIHSQPVSTVEDDEITFTMMS